jgi:hypothetical protein
MDNTNITNVNNNEPQLDINLDYMLSLKIFLETEYNIDSNSHSSIIRHIFNFLKDLGLTNGRIKTAINLLYESEHPEKIDEMHYILNGILSRQHMSNFFTYLSHNHQIDNQQDNQQDNQEDNQQDNQNINNNPFIQLNRLIESDIYTGNLVNPANILNYFTANLNNINVIYHNVNSINIPMFDLFSLDQSYPVNQFIRLPNGKETLTELTLDKVSNLEKFSNLDKETKTKFDTCSICFDDFKEENIVRQIKCNHLFHKDCIDPWLLKESYQCPVCRESTLPDKKDNPPDI